MKRPLVGTLHPSDYVDIHDGVIAAQKATEYLRSQGARIEIPTEHRWWEYGTAIQMMLDHYKERISDIDVLDVGSGWGAVGPALSLTYNTTVTEYEPGGGERHDRQRTIQILKNAGRKGINLHSFTLETMPAQDYDVVLCISVLEHTDPAKEKSFWLELGNRVRPNGLFYMTTDCVPEAGKAYTFDNLRTHNFVLDELKERVEMMIEHGFTPLGKPEYVYNGNYVHDFTFFRCGMIKNGRH